MNNMDIVKSMIPVNIYSNCCMDGLVASFRDVLCKGNKYISNMYNAWNFVLNHINDDFNLDFIKEINRICENDISCNCGCIRDRCISISGTSWIPEIPVVEDIKSNIKSIMGKDDCISKAIEMFCYLTRSQLFIDGNKHVALLVANAILLQGNIGMFIIPDRYLSEFKMLLVAFYENGDSSKLCKFLYEYCIISFKDGNTKIREDFDCYARIYNLNGMYYPCKYIRSISKEELIRGYRKGSIVELDKEYWVNDSDIVMY